MYKLWLTGYWDRQSQKIVFCVPIGTNDIQRMDFPQMIKWLHEKEKPRQMGEDIQRTFTYTHLNTKTQE